MVAPLRVGLAGLGTVGASVVRLIERQRETLALRCGRPVEIVAVSARSRSKDRGIDMKKLRWVADPVKLAADPGIDAFVELIGGEGNPARAAVTAALKAGKSVVTANKALLARHGVELAALAEKGKVALNFEAAVGGAIPVVKTLREGLAGNAIARIYGILNGTCNYMLTRMEQEKLSFDACLKEAQRLGYAEADPSFDIEGHDTAQKLAILASLTFGTRVDPDAIYVEGITSITTGDLEAADELGYRIKLLGVAVKTDKGIEQRVHPTMRKALPRLRWSVPAPAAWRPLRLWCPILPISHAARDLPRSGVPRPGSRSAGKRRCSATRAATTYACSPWTSREPRRPSPSGLPSTASRWNPLCSVTAARAAATIRNGRRRFPLSLSPMRPPRMQCERRWPRSSATA
jgi:homoserine dehydrogenase